MLKESEVEGERRQRGGPFSKRCDRKAKGLRSSAAEKSSQVKLFAKVSYIIVIGSCGVDNILH